MVSSDPLVVFLKVDMETFFNPMLRQAQQEVNALEKEANRVFTYVKRNARRIASMLVSVISMAKNVAKAIFGTMDPTFEALLNAVFIAAQSLMSMAIAYLQLPGPGAFIYAIIAGAAMGMSIGNQIRIMQGREAVDAQAMAVIQALDNLQSIVFTGFR